MNRQSDTEAMAARALERELQLVREAIELVASGGAARVTVASIRFGEPLLQPARELARARGVRVTPLWAPDDAGADLLVERLEPAETAGRRDG